jgi:hypothetical protein
MRCAKTGRCRLRNAGHGSITNCAPLVAHAKPRISDPAGAGPAPLPPRRSSQSSHGIAVLMNEQATAILGVCDEWLEAVISLSMENVCRTFDDLSRGKFGLGGGFAYWRSFNWPNESTDSGRTFTRCDQHRHTDTKRRSQEQRQQCVDSLRRGIHQHAGELKRPDNAGIAGNPLVVASAISAACIVAG